MVDHGVGAATGLLADAQAALARGDGRAAATAARAARRHLEDEPGAPAPHALAEACVIEAVALQLQFDYPSAFERALEALALLAEDQVALRARALNSCFVVCAESGDLDRALDFSRRAVELAEAGGDPSGAARAMHNRGMLLYYLGQYEVARIFLQDVVARFELLPQQAANERFARVNLAVACLGRARQVAEGGQPAEARALRQQAVDVLPPLPGPAGSTPHLADLTSLGTWVAVRSELGQLGLARQGLRHYLRLVRLAGRQVRFQAYAVVGLAAYHFHAGRVARGMALQRAAIARLAEAGARLEQLEAQDRLVRMHVAVADHAGALAALRAARGLRSGLALEQAALRDRMAMLERQLRQRLARQQEARAHQQRLAVIGRLLADIHLALDRPIAGVHAVLQCCAGAAAVPADEVLPRVIEHIDAAAGLVRQLKMFVYRAAPQAMLVGLHDALREAWAGIAPWRHGPASDLAIDGATQVRVRVDSHRLAVLLRILLMEAERSGPPGVLRVRLDHSGQLGCLELAGPGPRCGDAPPAGRVGLALCREIVQEMGGELLLHDGSAQRPGFVLRLPGG